MLRNTDARYFLPIAIACVFIIKHAFASDLLGGILMDCKLEGGYSDIQIYINEEKSYVLYNAQLRDQFRRHRIYRDKDGAPVEIDEGLNISQNNEAFIFANDSRSSFLLIKSSGGFAYAWTTLMPDGEGRFHAFGNHHQGTCSMNRFSQE